MAGLSRDVAAVVGQEYQKEVAVVAAAEVAKVPFETTSPPPRVARQFLPRIPARVQSEASRLFAEGTVDYRLQFVVAVEKSRRCVGFGVDS